MTGTGWQKVFTENRRKHAITQDTMQYERKYDLADIALGLIVGGSMLFLVLFVTGVVSWGIYELTYIPVRLRTQQQCLAKGYDNYKVTYWYREGFCIRQDGVLFPAIEKAE